jgi:hypothetical protein
VDLIFDQRVQKSLKSSITSWIWRWRRDQHHFVVIDQPYGAHRVNMDRFEIFVKCISMKNGDGILGIHIRGNDVIEN